MDYRKTHLVMFSLLFALILTACGSDKGNDSNQFPTSSSGVPSNVPKQSFVVRSNPQTGEAEMAPVDLSSTDGQQSRRNLERLAESELDWRPIDQDQTINYNSGYPQPDEASMYFIEDPRNFDTQNVMPEARNVNYSNRGYRYPGDYNYGYHRYRNYRGRNNNNYFHYYPSIPRQNNWYEQYSYQPAYYSGNAWVYYNPYYALQMRGFQYSFYTAWWY